MNYRTITTCLLASLLLLIFSIQCTAGFEQTPFDAPAQPTSIDWSALLRKPGPLSHTVFHTGRVEVPRSGMLNLEHPTLADEQDAPIKVEVFAHLVRHPTHGDYLIDSGFDESFASGGPGNISGIVHRQFMLDWEQRPGQDIAAHLERARVKLKAVFITHMHGDHTSGLPALPPGTRVIAGKNESSLKIPFIFSSTHFDAVSRVEEIDCSRDAVDSPVLGPVVDLLGDRSLFAICTPGHSPGHLSYLVRTATGPVLLTGDASHTKRGFQLGVTPGWVDDREAARESLRRLKDFHAKFPFVRVIYGHER